MSRRRSALETLFEFQLRALALPVGVSEFRFHGKRRWRFDFAWPDWLMAAEVEGGVYSSGRHTRGKGFEEDCEKYNEAVLLGWRVFRFSGQMVKSGEAVKIMERAFSEAWQ